MAVKKIIYICHQFPILTQTFVFNEVKNLINLGFDIHVHTMKPPIKSDLDALPDAHEIPSESLPPLASIGMVKSSMLQLIKSPVKSAGTFLKLISPANTNPKRSYPALPVFAARGLALAEKLNSGPGYDLIYTHGLGDEGLAAYAASVITGIPLVMRVHMPVDLIARKNIYRDMALSSKAIICESRFVREMLLEFCRDEISERTHVVHCGIEIKDEHRAAKENKTPLIVSVGSMDGHKKGHKHLIEAMGHINREGIDARLKIVGDGTLSSSLKRLATEVGVSDRVEFMGSLPHQDMLDVTGDADIFCLASIVDEDGDRDGIPVALIEAMGMGKPCVSTKLPPITELIEDGVDGLLVEEKNSSELARALARLINSAGLQSEIGSKARKKVASEFSSDKNADKLAGILSGL